MTVLITGASGGLGRALALDCAGRGFDLFLTDINQTGLGAVKRGIECQYAVRIWIRACDITSDKDVDRLVAYADENGIRIDMLFNVAGLDHEGGFTQRDFGRIMAILRLNIEATLRVTHKVLCLRRIPGRFHIVFVSSLASMYPIPLKATYAASKRFLLDFSIALGQELRDQDVSVLALCPGGLATTPESIRGIEAQGFWGTVTTNRLERVAHRTVSRSLRGRRLYVPGILNHVFSVAARFVPAVVIARLLYGRWTMAQRKWLSVENSGSVRTAEVVER